jgi:hypothetical protein
MSDPTSAPAKRRRIDLTLLRVLLPKSAAQVLHLDLLHRTWARIRPHMACVEVVCHMSSNFSRVRVHSEWWLGHCSRLTQKPIRWG